MTIALREPIPVKWLKCVNLRQQKSPAVYDNRAQLSALRRRHSNQLKLATCFSSELL
jgi:hypothetical protein